METITDQTPEYQCAVCSYIYEPLAGDATSRVPPGTPWEDIPETWGCPHCGASREVFRAWKPSRKPESPL